MPIIAAMDGTVHWSRQGQTMHVDTGRNLLPGDSLKLAAQAAISVRYPDGSVAEFDRQALVQFRQHHLQLDSGRLRGMVVPRQRDRPWRILTPHSQVTVVGTRFELEVDWQGSALAVSKGRVDIASTVGQRQVGAGERVQVGADGALVYAGQESTGGMTLLLRDAITGEHIADLGTENAFDLATLPSANVTIEALPRKIREGDRVRFHIPGLYDRSEAGQPFMLSGDKDGLYRLPWTPDADQEHELHVQVLRKGKVMEERRCSLRFSNSRANTPPRISALSYELEKADGQYFLVAKIAVSDPDDDTLQIDWDLGADGGWDKGRGVEYRHRIQSRDEEHRLRVRIRDGHWELQRVLFFPPHGK